MTDEIKFNYCVPREYKTPDGTIAYSICNGNEQMNVAPLKEIQKYCNDKKPKNAQPWIQIFTNGYRVMTDSIDYKDWNGMTFVDIDGKWFYKYCRPFDCERLLKMIHEQAQYMYNNNYYACHLTSSKQGYKIFWYWDCERTEENFHKCCILSELYTKDIFYSFGDEGREIIDFKKDRHRVLDRCSHSVFQGSYVTVNEILYSEVIDERFWGACCLDDITVEQTYEIRNIEYKSGEVPVKYNRTNDVRKEDIKYYPHAHRRCIYEALIRLFNDQDRVNEEWERVAKLLPESDGGVAGHPTKFYIEEPKKNKWYDRYFKNTHVLHKLDWLEPFGYEYEDPNEYVYISQFKRSWRNHCFIVCRNMIIDEKTADITDKKMIVSIEEDVKEKCAGHTIFDKFFDENIHDDRHKDRLQECRETYYKTRWSSDEFKWLTFGYEMPNDIVTYKMYADFYYRDKDNNTMLKYDLLEDEVKTYGYWPETGKMQWHTFKYNDEFTHWKNHDTFSNKATKDNLTFAVNKYASRRHSYHSIKEYFYSLDLAKTNEDLLDTWAIQYFDCDDTKLTREICRKWIIAAVKKLFVEDPVSFTFPHMLFIQGASGCGKTFFLTNMFTINGHSYVLNKIDPNGKDNEIGPLIAKNWLIQFSESTNLKHADADTSKEFMDRINEGMKYQKKYENEQTTIYPRIVSCRTSNDNILFNDPGVNEVDRRNWLLVCHTGVESCDSAKRKLILDNKDILWATAYKVYLDNPDMDLELTSESTIELGKIQEPFKLIKNDDINELYDDLFERVYFTNIKREIMDYNTWFEMLKHSDVKITSTEQGFETYTNMFIANNDFNQINTIDKIPVEWVTSYIKKSYGLNTLKLINDKMKKEGWINKPQRWQGNIKRCWVKIKT